MALDLDTSERAKSDERGLCISSETRAVDSSQLIGPLDFNVALPRLDASLQALALQSEQLHNIVPSYHRHTAFELSAAPLWLLVALLKDGVFL